MTDYLPSSIIYSIFPVLLIMLTIIHNTIIIIIITTIIIIIIMSLSPSIRPSAPQSPHLDKIEGG
jgi:hypothetical protein